MNGERWWETDPSTLQDSHYVIAEVPMRRGVSWWQIYDNRMDAEFMEYGYVRRVSSLEAAIRAVVALLQYDYAVASGEDY